jgi:tripartite-type tricarboxylate transporter receptor subunit TctC
MDSNLVAKLSCKVAYTMSSMKRLLTIASALCLVAASLAWLVPRPAAGYPDHPVHLLVPYPPGGPNDVVARLIAGKLDGLLGQPVIVENRGGGNGDIAMAAAARAAPDGHTLVLPGMPYAVNPSLFLHVGYSFDQFAPVSIVTKGRWCSWYILHSACGRSGN